MVYPFWSTEQQAIACILFINDNASRILVSVAGPLALVVSVSCAHTLRDILEGHGSGIFEPNVKCMHLPNAKSHLPGFYIDMHSDHAFTTTTRVLHVEPPGSY